MKNYVTVDPDTGKRSYFATNWDDLPIKPHEHDSSILMLDFDAEQQLDRQRLELVTGLTGGELMDQPWFYLKDNGQAPHVVEDKMVWTEDWFLGVFIDWYEGAPEYDEERNRSLKTYRTAVLSSCYTLPAAEIIDSEGVWKMVAHDVGSGEAGCYCQDTTETDSPEKQNPCVLCEGDGFVYVGQVIEVVYELVDAERYGE